MRWFNIFYKYLPIFVVFSVYGLIIGLLLFYPFNTYGFVAPKMSSIYLLSMELISLIFGLLIPYFLYDIELNPSHDFSFRVSWKKLFIINLIGLIFSWVSVLVKLFLILRTIGLTSILFNLGTIRYAYLSGTFSVPIVIRISELFNFPLFTINMIYTRFTEGKRRRYLRLNTIFFFLAIALSDILIGARSQIAFAIALIISNELIYRTIDFLKLGYGSHRTSRNFVLFFGMILFFLFSLFVNIQREQFAISVALEQLVTYVVGPLVATVVLFSNQIQDIFGSTLGYYTFGGILRFFFENSRMVSIKIPTDFGYTLIYKSLDYGFNSYTAFSYFYSDFGLLSLFYLFFVGIFISTMFRSFIRLPTVEVYFINVMTLSFLILSFRDLITKWISFWVLLIFGLFINKFLSAEFTAKISDCNSGNRIINQVHILCKVYKF